jgi:hypothetical protein
VSAARHRRKRARLERELVAQHKSLGVHAERYPLSGSSHFRGSGHDVDLYLFGRDEAPILAEVKSRANGAGFTELEKWLGSYDALFLRRNGADPLVVIPWHMGPHPRRGPAMTTGTTLVELLRAQRDREKAA